jgi:hypothetical protein
MIFTVKSSSSFGMVKSFHGRDMSRALHKGLISGMAVHTQPLVALSSITVRDLHKLVYRESMIPLERMFGQFWGHNLRHDHPFSERVKHLMHKKQFLANVEDAINSEIDLPSSIQRYQSTLQYARSKVDYVVGLGLYMIPSDMDLYIGTINGYNNLIIIAPDDLKLGQNDEVNDEQVQDMSFDSPDTSFDSPDMSFDTPIEPSTIEPSTIEPSTIEPSTIEPSTTITHDDQKLLLILGGTILGSAAIYALK